MQQYSEPIERFFSTGGTQPTAGYDVTSGVLYDAWALTNVQGFTKRVPLGYITGSALNVAVSESTPGSSKRHKWQAVVTLIRANSTTTDVAASETFTVEVVAPSTANQESNQVVPLNDASGQINGLDPRPSDIINVALSRIAATTNEDPNSIKVITYDLQTIIDQAAVSGCLGRVGKIIDRVFKLFNEISGEHLTSAEILDYLNQCSEYVTQREYWRATTLLDAVASQEDYDLLTLITNYERTLRLRWMTDTKPQEMRIYQDRDSYDRHKYESVLGAPGRYVGFIDSNTLYVWPIPTANATGAIEVYHSQYPGDLGCTDDYTPKIPAGHDMLYVYFALVQAFQKDMPSSKSAKALAVYEPKMQMELNRLFGQQIDQGFSVMPG